MHVDGARSWNAAVFLDMEQKEMLKDFDTIQVCLSKGLGAPIGSMFIGSHADIQRGITIRKMLGGAMR